MPLSFSLNSKSTNTSTASKTLSRPSAKPGSKLSQSLNSADDGPEPEAVPQQRAITSFGDGAEDVEVKEERIIPGVPNDANGVMGVSRKRRRNQTETPAENGEPTVKEEELNGKKELAFGLTVVDKPANDTETEKSNGAPAPNDETVAEPEEDLDSKALRALKGEDVGLPNTSTIEPPTEDEVFSRHFSQAPAPGTLQDYEATPVEGFGAAILRGYLKTGEKLEDRIAAHKRGEKANDPKNRPRLLGIGAKKAEGVDDIDLGVWGAKKGKDAPGYNPLVRKNRITNEVLTDTELKDKLDQQKKDGGSDRERDWKERKRIDDVAPRSRREDDYDSDRRDRRRDRDRDRERDRDRDRKDDYTSSRGDRSRDDYNKSSRRHRSRSADDRDRRRRDHYDNDDEYRNRRHRDRDHRDRSRERTRH